MEQDDQRLVDVFGRRLQETFESGYRAGYDAGVEKGREWLPQSIDGFVYLCAVTLGNCSTTVSGDDGVPQPWPTPEDLLETLRQPVPWSLATVIAELCRGVFVDPPPMVIEALRGSGESPFASSRTAPQE